MPQRRAPLPSTPGPLVARLTGVAVSVGGSALLADIDLEIGPGQRWVLLGPNGSGKTTLLRVLGGYLHPGRGSVELLGRALGTVDVRDLRSRIGQAGPSVRGLVRDAVRVDAFVAGGAGAVLDPAYRHPTPSERERARALLAAAGCAVLADRALGSLSSGEQQRVAVCRALMPDPDLLLLDEPFAGLDLAGREDLLASLEALGGAPRPDAVVLVVHHLEEIPAGFDHIAVLREGRLVAAGPTPTTLTGAVVSEAFGRDLTVTHRHGRYEGRLTAST